MFDGFQETGIDRFIIAQVVHDAFRDQLRPSRRVIFGSSNLSEEASCACGKGRRAAAVRSRALSPPKYPDAALGVMPGALKAIYWL